LGLKNVGQKAADGFGTPRLKLVMMGHSWKNASHNFVQTLTKSDRAAY